jgi:2-amino-4-hydroxy-6-hydroxymethyldihydropteridine diphosphokinase
VRAQSTRLILLGLGANQAGAWGSPAETLRQTLIELPRMGAEVAGVSRLYQTLPVGGPSQGDYRNAVVAVHCNHSPGGLLRDLKELERRAGRRLTGRWGPRALDIDILSHGGRLLGWGRRLDRSQRPRAASDARVPPGLVIPHPRLHTRAFVLVPLLDLAPHWHHPGLGQTARALLADMPHHRQSVRLSSETWPRPVSPKAHWGILAPR